MPPSLQKISGQIVTSGTQIALLFIGLQLESRAGWVICLVVIAIISLLAWVSAMNRRRAITDTPISRIGSAAQGYVELSGTGRPLDESPLRSELTGLPCLWYRFHVEERTRDRKWSSVQRGESEVSFLIEDGSGRCVVDVENAEIFTRHKKSWTQGSYRYTEWTLAINDHIYALGDFKTLGGGSVDLDARSDLNELLTEWKKDKATLLKRFDLDGDGQLDLREWGLARQAARREVSRLHREARDESDVHTMVCPVNGRHYLISNIDPNGLARRYLLWSLFHLALFLAALGALPWALRQPV